MKQRELLDPGHDTEPLGHTSEVTSTGASVQVSSKHRCNTQLNQIFTKDLAPHILSFSPKIKQELLPCLQFAIHNTEDACVCKHTPFN